MSYELSDEQKRLLNDAMNNFREWRNQFMEDMKQAYKERIKPILDRIKAQLEDNPKLKIEYGIVKLIRYNSCKIINKSKLIHCRNNC